MYIRIENFVATRVKICKFVILFQDLFKERYI